MTRNACGLEHNMHPVIEFARMRDVVVLRHATSSRSTLRSPANHSYDLLALSTADVGKNANFEPCD
jgi:hypothetical protein